ncbi:hydrogenase maturation protease [uncultured bacterium]|nr:hydrogenase maturation protease [uncultured bacterium]
MARKTRKKALVLGIGNLLLKDEGLGVRAVEVFKRDYSFGPEVSCLDGGTSGLGLLTYIQEFTHIVIVDAVRAKGAPGTVLTFPGDKLQSLPSLKSSSAHQIGVKDLLDIARFQGLSPELALVGIIPKDISAGMELTPEARNALSAAAEAVRAELEKFGFKATRKAA